MDIQLVWTKNANDLKEVQGRPIPRLFHLLSDLRYKKPRLLYYFSVFCQALVPQRLCRRYLKHRLNRSSRFDAACISRRVAYYNRLCAAPDCTERLSSLAELNLPARQRTYYFDTMQHLRYFNFKLKGSFLFGDITHVPDHPAFTKSRPIGEGNENSVVLKLDRFRHFLFIRDRKPFPEKRNLLVGRSHVSQPHRIKFLEMYFNHPLCNLGQINCNEHSHKWQVDRMTIHEHLDYKFILCLEGNDVATNLKWVMSSNSLAVMPRPSYESWFMEGTLIPNVHYVEIKRDFSDLDERLNYYIEHTGEALQIIENAHHYVRQFQNKRQEELISLLVMQKYFRQTGQLSG